MTVRVLMIEDNPGDVELTTEALDDAKLQLELEVAPTAEQGLQWLEAQLAKEKPQSHLPHLILLDLNLPGMRGQDLLSLLKGRADLRHIPVVILTSSSSEADILKSYDLQAAAYILKPVDFDGFCQVVRCIEGFWFRIVALPHHQSKDSATN